MPDTKLSVAANVQVMY